MAIINLGTIRFNWCGEYSDATTYYPDDVVGCNGSSYIAKKTTKGISIADREVWDLMVAGAEKPYVIGEQKLMPFRASELPPGWYFRNGDNYLLDSQQGRALDSLSEHYKEDFKITIKAINDRQYINVPSAFAPDGRGYFERAVNGTTHQVGSVEDDAIRQIYGEIFFHGSGDRGSYLVGGSGVFYGIKKQNAYRYGVLSTDWPSYGGFAFDTSCAVPTANENRPINIGLTPAIYLGV